MCGFAGIFAPLPDQAVDRGLLHRMTDRLLHRGPDGSGYYFGAGVGLGHRRLSIIDVAGGAQPMFNETRDVVTVFNGEIYNHRDLARELTALGHRFASHCDTEVIVHAWEEWGEECVQRFRGMFALALWDARREMLFLARDRLGIKPLYFTELADGRLVFGSELKALLVHPDVPRRFDTQAIEDYFALGYVPDPKTIYRGVEKLPPGHLLCLKRRAGGEAGRAAGGGRAGGLEGRPRDYWPFLFGARQRGGDETLARDLLENLRESVRLRMLAEVPLGAFLSGGLDSSAVVGLMSQAADGPIQTCSLGFAGSDQDETGFAETVARHFHSDHVSRKIGWPTPLPFERLARIFDEPFADNSALATERLCQLARERVAVALSGDGADEVFAGYRRYPWHLREERLRSLLPQGLRAAVFGPLGAVYPKLDRAPRPLRAQYTLRALAGSSLEGCLRSVALLPEELRRRLYSRRLRSELQGYGAIEALRPHWDRSAGLHPLDRFQYLDLKTYLPGDILTKVDRASMAHSLEVRVPFLDHELVEWASGIPPERRLRGSSGKLILKEAVADLLPPEIPRRKKVGFHVPLSSWLTGPALTSLRASLDSEVLRDLDFFDEDCLDRIFRQQASGQRDHGRTIWSLATFAAFLSTAAEV